MAMMEDNLILVLTVQVLVITLIVVGIGVLLLRNLVCRSRDKPRHRAVLVTGCDSGVGLALATHLDSLGFRVFAGVREPCGAGAARLQEATSAQCRLLQLDVTRGEEVEAAVASVREALHGTGQELWAVVNNAGVCIPGELQWLTWQQCQRSIEVNLTGAVRVTRAFLPQLQRSQGRVVFVTSSFAAGGLPGVGLLAATSAALDALGDCLRLEALGQVKVASVRLGDFSLTTDLLSHHHREVGEMRRTLSDVSQVDRFASYQDAVAARGLSFTSDSLQTLPSSVCAAFEDALLTRRPHRAYDVSERVGARAKRGLLASLPGDVRDALVMRHFRRRLPKVTHL